MAGFHTTGPNQALIVSGGGREPKVVVGGRIFVIPLLQRVQTLSLEVMTLTPSTNRVYTKEGVAVSVDGVAQVKVKAGAILQAAQQFLGKRLTEIEEVALQTLEGNQRAILGTMTVEEIYQDREGFATRVLEVGSADMDNMGLEIVSYTIRDIQDEQGYLEALGIPRTAEVKRDAAIAQAEADRDAAIVDRHSTVGRLFVEDQLLHVRGLLASVLFGPCPREPPLVSQLLLKLLYELEVLGLFRVELLVAPVPGEFRLNELDDLVTECLVFRGEPEFHLPLLDAGIEVSVVN